MSETGEAGTPGGPDPETAPSVLIVGGESPAALDAAERLVAAGHRVTSVVRSDRDVDAVTTTGARPVLTRIETLDAARLPLLLAGQDVVVWAVGVDGQPPRPGADAARELLAAAVAERGSTPLVRVEPGATGAQIVERLRRAPGSHPAESRAGAAPGDRRSNPTDGTSTRT